MCQEQQHVCERYSPSRVMRNIGFVVQPTVDDFVSLYGCVINGIERSIELLQIDAFHDCRRRPIGFIRKRSAHDVTNVVPHRIDANLEDTGQSLATYSQHFSIIHGGQTYSKECNKFSSFQMLCLWVGEFGPNFLESTHLFTTDGPSTSR